jgi:PKD repeat protein
MEKENLNIEDLFRQSFDGYKINPPDNLWNKINYRLNLKQFLKPNFGNFNIYYSSLIIGIVTAIALLLSSRTEDKPLLSSNTTVPSVNTKINNETKDLKKESRIYKIKLTPNKTEQKSLNHPSNFVSKQIEFEEENNNIGLSTNQIQNIEPVLKVKNDSSNKFESLMPYRPKPVFSIACKEGCTPFELKLNNFTQGATNYYWTFGDGGKSKDESPVYTYNYPGVYRIQLKATGVGGTAVSVIDSIVVHDKPSIKASWQHESEISVGEKIYIPIEAQNIKRFEWSFGDGSIINKKQAEHSYKSVGQYSIQLKSWSEYGCYDSVKIADINVVTNDKRIVFPNAFCPNPGGPSSGKYSDRESYIDIFHPITSAGIAEYKLVIYSRVGAIVFESDDIK